MSNLSSKRRVRFDPRRKTRQHHWHWCYRFESAASLLRMPRIIETIRETLGQDPLLRAICSPPHPRPVAEIVALLFASDDYCASHRHPSHARSQISALPPRPHGYPSPKPTTSPHRYGMHRLQRPVVPHRRSGRSKATRVRWETGDPSVQVEPIQHIRLTRPRRRWRGRQGFCMSMRGRVGGIGRVRFEGAGGGWGQMLIADVVAGERGGGEGQEGRDEGA